MLSSICVLIFKSPENVITSMMSASTSSLELCINLIAVYAVWLGILEIVDKSGLGEKLSKLLSPVIKKLFKSKNPEANKYIAINLSSNILGLGNAATPSGIKAMQMLDDKTKKPTFAMIMLLIVNATSISLIPTTTIGIRETAGSINSASIILPTIITSVISLVVGILLVFIFFGKKRQGADE